MHNNAKIDAMLSEISANIEKLEKELKEEYKKMIRVSSNFDDIAVEFVLLKRKSLPKVVMEYENTAVVDRLCDQLEATFGPERDRVIILEAGMVVMDENISAAVNSRN